jgi:hypothetical protein
MKQFSVLNKLVNKVFFVTLTLASISPLSTSAATSLVGAKILDIYGGVAFDQSGWANGYGFTSNSRNFRKLNAGANVKG